MDFRPKCPACASRYPAVRGMLYAPEFGRRGRQCENPWHIGSEETDPSVLRLTEYDKKFLADMCVGAGL